MIFIKLKDGRELNAIHISQIKTVDNDVVYEPAKGSLNDIREHYDTEQEALTRYAELSKLLLVK